MNSIDAQACCPFFVRTTQGKNAVIICEGVFSSTSHQHFLDKQKLVSHAEKFCCKDHRACPHHKSLMKEKYSSRVFIPKDFK